MYEKKAALTSLGCKVNSYEAQAMEQSLIEDGYTIVPFDSVADVYVINTCTVTATSDKKSRQMIRRAKQKNPEALVIACGCYTQKNADTDTSGCDIILGNNHKGSLTEVIRDYEEKRESSGKTDNTLRIISDISAKDTPYEETGLQAPANHTRGFIKVQDGCDRYCAYCIIPSVRGRSRSRALSDIVAEAGKFAGNGCREIVLCAVNLSDYSHDGFGLTDIIQAIDKIDGIERIRLGSLEPDVFTDSFTDAAANTQKLCPHFHLSLQSGCDNTLRRMKRRYTIGSCEEAVKRIRNAFGEPAIWADVIAGFPGETEEDFEESYDFIKSTGFAKLHVFPYSKREGTKAALFPEQLKKSEKDERTARLLALSSDMARYFMKKHLEKECEVLFEEQTDVCGSTFWTGFTKDYIKVIARSGEDLKNVIAPCLAKDISESGELLVSLLLNGDILK